MVQACGQLKQKSLLAGQSRISDKTLFCQGRIVWGKNILRGKLVPGQFFWGAYCLGGIFYWGHLS